MPTGHGSDTRKSRHCDQSARALGGARGRARCCWPAPACRPLARPAAPQRRRHRGADRHRRGDGRSPASLCSAPRRRGSRSPSTHADPRRAPSALTGAADLRERRRRRPVRLDLRLGDPDRRLLLPAPRRRRPPRPGCSPSTRSPSPLVESTAGYSPLTRWLFTAVSLTVVMLLTSAIVARRARADLRARRFFDLSHDMLCTADIGRLLRRAQLRLGGLPRLQRRGAARRAVRRARPPRRPRAHRSRGGAGSSRAARRSASRTATWPRTAAGTGCAGARRLAAGRVADLRPRHRRHRR